MTAPSVIPSEVEGNVRRCEASFPSRCELGFSAGSFGSAALRSG